MYDLIKRKIDKKKIFTKAEAEDLQSKLDLFLLMDRMSKSEYEELTKALTAKTEKDKEEVSKA